MKKRILTIVSLVLCLVMALCACGKADENIAQKGTDKEADDAAVNSRLVNVAYTGIAETFEPTERFSFADGISYSQVYDTLLRRDLSGEYHPSVAKEWKVSEDGLTYTFNLDERATFSNGDPVTANDVAYSLEREKNSKTHSTHYQLISEINVLDEHTVEVVLTSADPTFMPHISLTVFFCILNKKVCEELGEDYGTSVETTVGSGPYVLTDWVYNVSQTFKAREDYFLGAPEIKEFVFHTISDANAVLVALQTGELDIGFTPISGTGYNTIKTCENINILEYDSARFECIHPNCVNGIFSDVRMRKALAMAVNPNEAVIIGADGLGLVSRYPGDISAIAGNPNYDSPKRWEYNVEKAKALVKECGNTGKKVNIISYNFNPYSSLSVWLQNALNNIGLDAFVTVLERGAVVDSCNAGQFDVFISSLGGLAYEMDDSFSRRVDSSNAGATGNCGSYKNAEMDELLNKGRSAVNIEERYDIYRQAIDKMYDDVPLIPLYAAKSAIPVNKEITTKYINSVNMFDYTWAK